MDDALRRDDGVPGLLRIEDCLDADGGVALPPGVNLISLIDRNIANVGDTVAIATSTTAVRTTAPRTR